MIGLRSRRAERPQPAYPGFFGKVPTRGDFVSADLDPRFQQDFDRWLQRGMAASRQALGETWEARFLAAPAWRFVLSAGLCGPHAAAGVFLPSRDRIGRCFPLVLMARLDGFAGDSGRVSRDHAWFAALEAIAATAAQPDLDILAFRAELRRVRPACERPGPSAATPDAGSLWWTAEDGGARAPIVTASGMPPPERFAEFFGAGDAPPPRRWDEDRAAPTPIPPVDAAPPPPVASRRIPAEAVPPVASPPAALPRKLRLRAAVAEHRGLKARFQADAALVLETPGVLGVVDGVGDDRAGVNAARMVVEALAGLPAHDTLEALIADLKGKIGRVHALLRAAQNRQAADDGEGGASVAVLARMGERFQVVWIGDVRCYLLREGMMRCLSRDHVDVGMRRRLSRSVGGAGAAMPDSVVDRLQPRDRFLLCSSPLARTLTERGIAETLIANTLERACELLVQDAVLAQTAENVTALVADVLSD